MPDLFTGADLVSAVSATVLIRAGAVLALAWVVTRLLSDSAASTRHAIWSAALAALLLLPLGGALLPRWNIPGTGGPLPVSSLPPQLSRAAAAPMVPEMRVPQQPHAIHGPVMPPTNQSRRTPPLVIALLLLWAAGAVIGLVRLALCLVSVSRLSRGASPAPAGVRLAADAARAELGLRRSVAVRSTARLNVPVNWGVVRPVILLPSAAASWDAERLRVVLLHELAHVRRWDYAALLVARVAQALYWMNPLVWIAARESELELERACDDEVLRAGTTGVAYATHLHAIAERLAGSRQAAGALAMARPSTLRERVAAILARTTDRRPLSRRAAAAAACVMALVALPLAGVRLMGEGRTAAEIRGAMLSLNLPDPAWRTRGAFALGTRHAREAAAQLEGNLANDPDPAVRGMAAWALGQIGERRSLEPLGAALRDRDPHVREMAVLALGALGDARAVPLLEPLVSDSFDGVRSVLTTALENIHTPEAGRVLARITTRDGDEHTRMMAGYSTRLVLGPEAVETFIALLRDTSATIRRMAINNLGDLADPRAAEALADVLARDSSGNVRSAAAWALGKLGTDAAVTALSGAMSDPDWHVRMNAASGLGRTGGLRAADLLMRATRDSVHQVRLTAVEALEARAH